MQRVRPARSGLLLRQRDAAGTHRRGRPRCTVGAVDNFVDNL